MGFVAVDSNEPAGTMKEWGGGTTPPKGYLLCDGASLLQADYPVLFAAIGTRWGTADGTHFNLPDMRGRIARGRANGSANDPDRAGRTASAAGGATGDAVGSVQNDAMQGHWHDLYSQATMTSPGAGSNFYAWGGGPFNTLVAGSNKAVKGSTSDGSSGTPRTSSESRMKNAYVDFIIKY